MNKTESECLAAIVMILVLAPAAFARQTMAIVGGILIDVSNAGHSTVDIRDSVVLISDGKITAVGDRGSVPLPANAAVINASGRYIIPGLIDGFGAMRSQGYADAYLYEGVTTVIVPTAPEHANVDGESSVLLLKNSPSDLTVAPISGYAMNGDIPDTSPWLHHRLIDRRLDHDALVNEVRAAAAAGNRIVSAGLDVWPDQLDTIVNEAHELQMAVTAEVAFTSYPYAIHAGVDTFLRNDKYSLALSRAQDFLAYADDPRGPGGIGAVRAVCSGKGFDEALASFAAQLKDSHTTLMPALSMEATADDLRVANPWTLRSAAFVRPQDLDDPIDPKTGGHPYLASHPGREAIIQACARNKQEVDRRLHQLGAVYLAGSSAPSFGVLPGGGLHVELELLQSIGLSAREALAAATSNIADTLRLADRGRLELGRRADLVILTEDPRVDASAVNAIGAVILSGKTIDRAALMKRARADRSP
jgi:Amidohydrolase family